MKFVLTFEKIDGEFCDRECPLFVLDAETDTPLCSPTSEKVVENELRPDWCPLKEAAYFTDIEKWEKDEYKGGWNDAMLQIGAITIEQAMPWMKED